MTISKGYAIDAHGEEIVVPETAHLDVCKSVAEGETGYLAVRFHDGQVSVETGAHRRGIVP